MPAYKNPDEELVPLFRYLACEDFKKSLEEGRPIFQDVEVCEIRSPGSKEVKIARATDVCGWVDGPNGSQVKITFAERFRHQYQQFKAEGAQTKAGTPLDAAPFLTDARRAELRAQNVYTVEQLADIDGQELKNLGPGGREFKNKAVEWIEEVRQAAPNRMMLAELEALKARNAILEEDAVLKAQKEAQAEGEFASMSLDQLREYITTNTGHAPLGSNNRKNLVRMAMECRPEKVA